VAVAAEVFVQALTDRFDRLEARSRASGMDADAIGDEMVDGHEHGRDALAAEAQISKRGAQVTENPWILTLVIAVGIGAHNFAEGLAIGASAATGATALAIGLIVGLALHNTTEGFGIVAPMAGRMVPSWRQLALAALIGGGPTLIGTLVGYAFTSPALSVFFLTTAVGALVFVIGELWSMLKRASVTALSTGMVTLGFVVAMATELFLDVSGA